MELPSPSPALALERLRGAWYVIASDRSPWRLRTHPRLDLEPLEHGRLATSTSYCELDWVGREHARVHHAVACPIADRVGQFEIQGLPWLRRERFCVAAVEPDHRWAVLWFAGLALGSPTGLDVLSRDPWIPQARLDAIVAAIAEHPRLAAHRAGLHATTHHWIAPEPYRF